jgi:hypothetical protein
VTRRNSPSIYEHILAHVEPGEPGLQEGGEALPDDAEFETAGGLRWAAGARDGTSFRYGPAPDDPEERVQVTHRALLELADQPGRRARNVVTELFRTGAERAVVRELVFRLRDEPPSDPDALYTELRTILIETRNREELKFAIAIVGSYGRAEDADVFRAIARHEEFTFNAAMALAYGAEDFVGEWLALLPDVSGWGATELSGLLLHAEDERARGVLLRRGVAIGNALDLAVRCRLHEALNSDDVDDYLLRGARSILDGLTWSFTEPESLFDYPDAGVAVERFLELLAHRASTLHDLITASELGRFLESEDDRPVELVGERIAEAPDQEDRERALACVGFDDARIERVQELSRTIVARPEWRTMTAAALASDDRGERGLGIESAVRLRIPLRDHLVRCIESDPNDSFPWYHLTRGADAEQIAEAVRLAERVLDLDALASGPTLSVLGPPDGPYHAADNVLWELKRFPGVGERILLAALESPSSRQRRVALHALSRWPRETVGQDVWDAVERGLKDPEERLRADAAALLAGEPLPD